MVEFLFKKIPSLMSKSTTAPKKRPLPGKPDLKPEIFLSLKKILASHAPPLVVLNEQELRYELGTPKPYTCTGTDRANNYFGAVIIQKEFVGLYLMFVYDDPANLEKLDPELRKTLRGKSCFHIRRPDETLMKQIDKAVKEGLKFYKGKGAI